MPIINEENERKTRKKKCFFVPTKEIKGKDYNLSIQLYKENELEEVKHEKPEKIIQRAQNLEDEIARDLRELKKEV